MTRRNGAFSASALAWMLLLALRAGADAPAAPSLAGVLARLSRVEALCAEFHEEKQLSLLSVPLTSDGTFCYQKPRQLVRHTQTPHASSLLLQGDVLHYSEGERVETLDLTRQPTLGLLVDTIVSVLSGNQAALYEVSELLYEAESDGTFRIQLVPKARKLLRIVRSLSFVGRGSALQEMVLVDGHGDVTRTRFHHVAFGRLEPTRFKQVFRVGS